MSSIRVSIISSLFRFGVRFSFDSDRVSFDSSQKCDATTILGFLVLIEQQSRDSELRFYLGIALPFPIFAYSRRKAVEFCENATFSISIRVRFVSSFFDSSVRFAFDKIEFFRFERSIKFR